MSEQGLPAGARVGVVTLTVADLPRASAFYQDVLGFERLSESANRVALGAGGRAFLSLVGDPRAKAAKGTVGLFHFAVLYPSRRDLAAALRRLIGAAWPLQGASDHLVSEALYLADPEGNGIELYRDRPRDDWRWNGESLEMATLPLDLPALLAEPGARAPEPTPPGTVLGHVHLHVSNLEAAEGFYRHVVGFDLMTRYGRAASFLSAGGYHHHLGINTWGTEGAPPAPEGALGLREYSVWIPEAGDLDALADRLGSAGVAFERADGELRFRDPSGHRVVAAVG